MRKAEPPDLAEWRERMASAAGKLIYSRRKLIEAVNGRRYGQVQESHQ